MSATIAERFDVTAALPASSLALEASAGTGKTWTLTSLTVRYLAETDVTLPDILLVTFTRAATAELRERVRLRIAEALQAAEEALEDPSWTTADPVLERIVGDARRRDDGGAELTLRRDRLRRAAQQLDEATISTIHGFCQRMLQHAALEAGVDFDAVLLDDDADLLAEIVDDHLARQLRPASADWVRYLRDCGGVDRARLTDLARQVAGLPSLRLLPDLVEDGTPIEQPWVDAVDRFRDVWTSGGRQRAIDLVTQMHEEGAFPGKQATFTGNRAVKEAAKVDAWLDTTHEVPPGKVDRKTPHNIKPYPMSYFTVASLRTKLPDDAPDPQAEVLDAAAGVLDAALAPATRFLHRAATYVWDELDRRKRQRTVLTFDDLLRRLADALEDRSTRTAVRQAIRQRYQVALIDEFQDTDAVQWRIFTALFDADEPFILIGDPKQAIYAFRGADIHTYVTARDTRPDLATLQTNRRSDTSYVQACNTLFGPTGAFATPDIPYHRIDAHHDDRLVDRRGRAALQLRYVHRDAGEVDKGGAGALTKGWANRALPGEVAAQVVDLLGGEVTVPDGGGNGGGDDHRGRPLAPHDLAVLVRTNRRAEAVQRALRTAGVPAVIQRGGSVFATEEADALQRLLTALLRPGYERAAVAAAASVLFGRDAATLVEQRDALDRQAAADDDPDGGDAGQATRDDELARGWDAWIDALTRWGERWQRHGVQPAIRAALAEDGAAERLLSTPEGERRLTNVRHLVELLHEAETVEGLTPNRLVEWLQVQRADAADGEQPTVATELRLEEDAEAVRVVTVHGSKGLQYPVVLCPDLWDGAMHVNKELTRFHDPDVEDPREATFLDLDADVTSDRKRRSIELAEQAERLEQLRLAYVALTRAEHRCIVWWGPFNDAGTSALASLLHGGSPDTPEDRLTRGEERVSTVDDEDLVADLRQIADGSGGTIDVEVVTEVADGARWRPDAGGTVELAARRFDRGDVDRSWRRVSFTSLVRDASGHASGPASGRDEARDIDAGTEPDDAELTDGGPTAPGLPGIAAGDPTTTDGAGTDDVPLAAFPRGAGPGTFLHDVLERVDLGALDDDAAVVPLLEKLERRHGVDPEHRPTVLAGLRAAVLTPLGPVGGDARLADLGPGVRLNELRFELPLGGGYAADREAFTLGAIADLFQTSADPLVAGYAERLRDPALRGKVRGFLNGSIDLLARLPDGRFLVADYKSNWLGDRATGRSTVADYHQDALAEAMVDHHYVLQAVLYLVATHRYLRWRIPGYDYARHVAGGGYLFLRGMVGPGTPRGADGHPHGVAPLRPEADLVTGVSRLLDGGRP